jgi:predicted metal-binding membrane protein
MSHRHLGDGKAILEHLQDGDPELVAGGHETDSSATGVADRSTARHLVGLTATIGLAGACWVLAGQAMNGMDMGVATQLGAFAFFFPIWIVMMGAMMLPGAAPATLRYARARGHMWAVPLFVVAYLAVCALVGVVVYAVDRPHGTVAAGVVVIAAGLYEFTPLKRRSRRGCRELASSGVGFGVYCIGCSIGLMAIMVAVAPMSILWMTVIAVIVVGQKLVPTNAAIDVPLALAVVALGIIILVAPSAVPGLTPMM